MGNLDEEKYWNTKKIQEHMNENQRTLGNFESVAEIQQGNYHAFAGNETYQGRTATAAKSYVEEIEAVLLKENKL